MFRLLPLCASRLCALFLILCFAFAGARAPVIATAQSTAPTSPTLDEAIKRAITDLKGEAPAHGLRTDVLRRSADGQWAFGTLVILTPKQEQTVAATDGHVGEALPEGRLWLARSTPNGWEAAIDYTPTFDRWLQNAPSPVINTKEQTILRSDTGADAEGELAAAAPNLDPPDGNWALPWTAGQRWRLSGGTHSWNGKLPVLSSVDFAQGEGDGRVLAARDGLIYRPCGNNTYVMIKHADGWQTDYYHLVNIPLYQDGSWVESGRYLGNVGTAVECGGSANGAHVHFNIRYNGEYKALAGRQIGGWTFRDGEKPYEGCAERDAERVCAVGLMRNYDTPPTAYDSDNAAIVYDGSWNRQTGVTNTYGNTLHSSTSVGSTARLSFTGRRVSLLYSMLPNGGQSDVYIDGQYRETIQHRAAETRRQVIKTWELGFGNHTVEVRVKGDGAADVDAFAVNLVSASPGYYENTNAQWRTLGTWQQLTGVAGASGGTLSWSSTPGSAMRFMFTGDRITYVYSKTPYRGIAAITIDGEDKGYIDMYSPNVDRQQRTMFENLGPGVHVVHITVTGQKSAAALDHGVDVDRVHIPTHFVFIPMAVR